MLTILLDLKLVCSVLDVFMRNVVESITLTALESDLRTITFFCHFFSPDVYFYMILEVGIPTIRRDFHFPKLLPPHYSGALHRA